MTSDGLAGGAAGRGPETAQGAPGDVRCAWLAPALAVAAALLVLVHATQWGLRATPAQKDASLVDRVVSRLTAADLLLAAAFALWCADTVRKRAWRRVSHLPAPAALFVAWAALSLIPALKGREGREILVKPFDGAVEVLQLAEYLVAAYLVFRWAARRTRGAAALMAALFVATTANVGLALWQYLRPAEAVSAMRVAGAFGNRNVLAGYLALAAPLLMGYALGARCWALRAWAGLIALASLLVVTAGGPFAGMVLGLLIVLYLHRRWLIVPVGAAVIVLLVGVFPHHTPRRNDLLLYESVALYRTEDRAGALGTRLAEARAKAAEHRGGVLRLTRALFGEAPLDRAELRRLADALPTEADTSWPWQQRYQEWQAAANMVVASPLFGVGAGSYQANVEAYRQYAGGQPLPAKMAGVNLMEEDALSLYAVWAACLGLPGLFLLFWLVLRHAVAAAEALAAEDAGVRGLALGCTGALAALAVSGVFTDFLVRGVGFTLSLVLALAAAAIDAARSEQTVLERGA